MSDLDDKRFDYDSPDGTPYFTLYVVYKTEHHEWGEPDEEFYAVIGHADGAGTGFGERDMDWSFVDEASANEAMRRVEEVTADRPGFTVSVERNVLEAFE